MLLDSARAFKDEISDEVVAEQSTSAARVSFFEATERPMPDGIALGISRRSNGEYSIAIRSEDPAKAAAMAARVHGEADVRIVTVVAKPPIVDPLALVDIQTTPGYFQSRVRPLEPGAQVNIAGANFVGTLGAFVRDAAGRLYMLSNSHVLADVGATPIGTQIAQPFAGSSSMVAVLDRFVPISASSPNLVDAAIARLDRTTALVGFNSALGGNLQGIRPASPSDLGAKVVKAGRTTGVQRGKVTAIEVDGLGVNYGSIGVRRFNDQVEFSGGTLGDFSAAGDSGSLIVREDGFAIALLFAGGSDASGEDVTFGNPIEAVLSALGVTLALT